MKSRTSTTLCILSLVVASTLVGLNAGCQNVFRIMKSVMARYPKPRSSTATPHIRSKHPAWIGSKSVVAPRKRKPPPVMIPNTCHPVRFLAACIPLKMTQGPTRANMPPRARKNNRAGSPTTMIKMLIHQRSLAALDLAEANLVVAYFIVRSDCDVLFSAKRT